MRPFPFLDTSRWLLILRVALGLFLAAHGVMRIYAGTVGGFGGFLGGRGFPLGVALAWTITFYEILGGSLLALGRFTRLICAGFVIHQVMAIILVHAPVGWFVVGYTQGGMEYSVLLILGFLLTASTASPGRPRGTPDE